MIESFKQELDKAGLSTREKVIPDGRLHRFHVEGDSPGSKNGWYVLYGDGVPAGSFGSWKTGDHGTWCAKMNRDLTHAQREEYRRRMDAARKAREAEEPRPDQGTGSGSLLRRIAGCPPPVMAISTICTGAQDNDTGS